jgi:hypothetical protein
MNSYIEKYEFKYPETYEFIYLYEFISPGDLSFHAYEFICIRWYIKKLATDGGGRQRQEVDGRQRREVDGRQRRQFWSLVQIPTRIQFVLLIFMLLLF